ncbi:Mas-related G-protein coupled receptor member G [Tupaia chinensis]|uniref:Mas-related G-protein coupled receptor member G n=1 Tax=Tupaia chinensis TaxID=246437 RepID=L9LAL4_TUPCH|nr:Mas-related G-protein coupled receptor member G [Tupaia chinensis]
MFGLFGIWRTFTTVVFYLTLVIALAGLVGNGIVLWNLLLHVKKGPLSLYLLHLAIADLLFLACQVAFSIVQAALGSEDTLYFAVAFVGFSAGLWLLAAFSAERCLSELFPNCCQGCRLTADLPALPRSQHHVAPGSGLLRLPAVLAGMFGLFGIWRTFTTVVFYLTLVIALAGLVGNGIVLWNLLLHVKKGPLSLYLLHLAIADLLFLACQGCRPRHTSAILCIVIWGLTLPAVLLPANACGLLRSGTRLLTCLHYHAASITWLLALVCVTCAAGLVLFIWVSCCSQRQRPKFYGITLGSMLLLLFCGLPFVLYWSLRPLLNFLLPMFPPLPTLLACINSSARPLMYFVVGRQPGRREPLRAVLQRALGEGSQMGAGGLALPMGHM